MYKQGMVDLYYLLKGVMLIEWRLKGSKTLI
jgi:hypothetical protein